MGALAENAWNFHRPRSLHLGPTKIRSAVFRVRRNHSGCVFGDAHARLSAQRFQYSIVSEIFAREDEFSSRLRRAPNMDRGPGRCHISFNCRQHKSSSPRKEKDARGVRFAPEDSGSGDAISVPGVNGVAANGHTRTRTLRESPNHCAVADKGRDDCLITRQPPHL